MSLSSFYDSLLLSLTNLFMIIGFLYTIYLIYTCISFLYYHFGPANNLSKYGAKKGAWALVTGGSDGIGKGIAENLALKGFNIVLLARNIEKLNVVASELSLKYKIETKCIVVDICNENYNDVLSKIISPLHELGVSLLVNNVGVSLDMPAELVDMSYQDIDKLIDCNIRFSTKLTRLMIPYLKNRNFTKSAIINVSSFSALIPAALLSVYAGTKAYNDAFSYALSAELAPYNIDVLSILPAYVVTNMSKLKNVTLEHPNPMVFGNSVVHKLGQGYSRSLPYWVHDLMAMFARNVPEWWLFNKVRSEMQKARSKQLLKQAIAESVAET